jgi:hypothetical protein
MMTQGLIVGVWLIFFFLSGVPAVAWHESLLKIPGRDQIRCEMSGGSWGSTNDAEMIRDSTANRDAEL